MSVLSISSNAGAVKPHPPITEAVNPLDISGSMDIGPDQPDPNNDDTLQPPPPLSSLPSTLPASANEFSYEETRDLLICLLFVIKDLNNGELEV